MSTGPTPASYGPTNAPPPSYLAWGIVATVLFCLPLGVVSIVHAGQVNRRYHEADYAGAQDSSDKARRWALWATIAGLVAWVLVVVLATLGVIAASHTSTSY
jgi:uncharacterized membrane protein